jgi:putative spermidine/putrescine transport system ATP-binding protein
VTPDTSAAQGATGSARSAVGVQLIDLCRIFGSLRALDNLNIDIRPGEFIAFLGPSGCGKTTALRIVAGLDDANSGQVLVGGRDIQPIPASKRDMGMVFQAYSLFPNMTAADNVGFGLRMRKVHKEERRRIAEEMLDLVGLAGMSNRYPNQLSGGQQQRVALARALAIRPSVLLLDEPLSALDAKVRGELRDEIKRIHKDVGTTTIFVTHDQEEAFALADRVAVINLGKLQQIAPPTDIYERPQTEFVAEFVGLTNRLPGVAEGDTVSILGDRTPLLDGSVKSGQVTVLVRPERLNLVPAGDDEANGRIVSVSFRGSICMVRARLHTDHLVMVQMQNADISQLTEGRPVKVSVLPVPMLAVDAAKSPSTGFKEPAEAPVFSAEAEEVEEVATP